MQKIDKFLMAVCLSSASTLSWADCERPDRPTVPNGAESTMEQMVEGQTAVKAYVAAGDEFIACLEEAEKSTIAAIDKDDEEAMAAAQAQNAERIKTHNEMVDEMQTVAGEWKESMTAFKAKSN